MANRFDPEIWICDVQESITMDGGAKSIVPVAAGLGLGLAAPELLPAIGIEGLTGAEAIGIGAGVGTTLGGLAVGEKPLSALEQGAVAGGLSYGGASLFGPETPTGAAGAPAGTSAAGAAPAPGVAVDTTSADLTSAADLTGGTPSSVAADLGVDSSGAALDKATAAVQGFGLPPASTPTDFGTVGPVSGAIPDSASVAADVGATPRFADSGIPPSKPPAPDSGGFFSNLGEKALAQVNKNPLGIAVSGLGLANNLIQGNQIPYEGQLKSAAEKLSASGATLQSYLQNGTLPPGAKAALDQATASAKAAVRSKYASMNLSGSTQEQQDLNNIDLQAATQAFQIADQLTQTGLQETGLAQNIYSELINATGQADKATGDAIANFATALSGGPVIKVG